MEVRVLDLDREKRKMALSMKQLADDPWQGANQEFVAGSTHSAQVEQFGHFGAILQLAPGISGLLPATTLRAAFGHSYRKKASVGSQHEVVVKRLDLEQRKVLLTLKSLGSDEDDEKDFAEYLRSQGEAASAPKDSGALGSFGALLQDTLKGSKQ